MRLRHLPLIRSYWDSHSEEYCASHPEHLHEELHPSWGLSHLPEDELRLLPATGDGRRLVDLGTGRGHDAVGFAERGYRVLAVDVSSAQLRRAIRHEHVQYVVADAERLPLPDASVDVVISDHGAFDHSPAVALLRESHRILRPSGLLVVCTYHPLALSCFDSTTGRVTQELTRRYPVAERQLWSDGAVVASFLGFSPWVNALRSTGFRLERVEEPLLREDQKAYFDELVTHSWSSRWPVDLISVARRTP
ncbi:class I SAM-dependent methyltransferase [Streptomyces sp. IBSBF 3136]|uniref:class I SAM-dependent methyltransferase n=1 Tax=Streptomyces sp. IBSBF 3136 TaxID=2903524 RepID=UPI002FDBF050